MNQNNSNTKIAITVDFKKYRIRIFKSTLIHLGMPKYIQFLVNPTKKFFAISPVEKANPKDQVHKIGPFTPSRDYEIYSYTLTNELYNVLLIDKSKSYRFMGEIIKNKNIALFSLNSAQPTNNI